MASIRGGPIAEGPGEANKSSAQPQQMHCDLAATGAGHKPTFAKLIK